ncbi:GNAT family N-acetyltransferase [Streptomyces sp. CB03238]|uniref:GNAT family N-acetyltransferase n=1 Tax=Streptomyces sp. CB03238 TaxID=1907777 RepID=UPI0015C44DBF|nr:GNAT family N-acetyltransferase [Streptomyces sp. CB03238]
MTSTNWTIRPERYDTPDATALRRDYYDDVASRYWHRPATAAEVDEGLTNDGVERLTPPSGQFVVGRADGKPAACGGVLMLDAERAEVTRVFIRHAFRGTGGATLLMDALESAAAGLGARRMVLNTRLDLVEARALYVRSGYREIPAYCEGPYKEIWYGKELSAR